jgi:hypothetical protein
MVLAEPPALREGGGNHAVRRLCAYTVRCLNNFLGSIEQKVVATADIPTGEKLILSASLE